MGDVGFVLAIWQRRSVIGGGEDSGRMSGLDIADAMYRKKVEVEMRRYEIDKRRRWQVYLRESERKAETGCS